MGSRCITLRKKGDCQRFKNCDFLITLTSCRNDQQSDAWPYSSTEERRKMSSHKLVKEIPVDKIVLTCGLMT